MTDLPQHKHQNNQGNQPKGCHIIMRKTHIPL